MIAQLVLMTLSDFCRVPTPRGLQICQVYYNCITSTSWFIPCLDRLLQIEIDWEKIESKIQMEYQKERERPSIGGASGGAGDASKPRSGARREH